jgi:hypothetical protein
MNRFLHCSVLASGLLLFGCSRQPAEALARRDPAPASRSAMNTAASKLQPENSRLPRREPIDAPTSVPNVAYYRNNFDQLFASGELSSLEKHPEVLKNREIGELLFAKLQAERRAGRFWTLGASLLAQTGNKAFAPRLWDEWKSSPSYEPTTAPSWDFEREAFQARSALTQAIFRIGDIETITAVWREFPTIAEGDQLVVAKASNEILDPIAATEIFHLVDRAKSERVRIELVNAANRILHHVFTNGTEADRRWARQVAEPLVAEMQKNGSVRDFLAKSITP